MKIKKILLWVISFMLLVSSSGTISFADAPLSADGFYTEGTVIENLPVETCSIVEIPPYEKTSFSIEPLDRRYSTFSWSVSNTTLSGTNYAKLGELSISYKYDTSSMQFIDFTSGPTLRNWNWGNSVKGVSNAKVTTTILNNSRLLKFTITADVQNASTGAWFPTTTELYHIIGE
jgi:hypothetical protein